MRWHRAEALGLGPTLIRIGERLHKAREAAVQRPRPSFPEFAVPAREKGERRHCEEQLRLGLACESHGEGCPKQARIADGAAVHLSGGREARAVLERIEAAGWTLVQQQAAQALDDSVVLDSLTQSNGQSGWMGSVLQRRGSPACRHGCGGRIERLERESRTVACTPSNCASSGRCCG